MVATGLALLALLGAWALYGRRGGEIVAAAGGGAPWPASSGDPVKAPAKPDTGAAAGENGRSKADDLSAELTQVTRRLDRIETTFAARLDQVGQRSDPNASARFADLSARLDTLEKKSAAPAPNSVELSELGTKLEKLEKKVAAATPSKEVSDLAIRLDKLEKRMAAALDGPARPEADAGTKHGSVVAKAQPPGPNGDARPGAARPVLRDYRVSDVQDGFAVVEGRYGTQEVAPGDFVPGAGRVLRIERRGGEWYVLTSNGVIGRGSGGYPRRPIEARFRSVRRARRGLHRPGRSCRSLLRQRRFHRRALGHAASVVEDAREAGRIDAVSLEPGREGEEIGVRDRIALAHHPGTGEHLALDHIETRADGLRDLAPHRFDRRRVVSPAVAAPRCAWATCTVELR